MRPDVVGYLYQQRDVGCVVQCAVIEIVCLYRRAKAISVKMGGHHDILIPSVGIRTGQQRQNVWRADVTLGLADMQLQPAGNLEAREWLLSPAVFQQARNVLPRAFEERGQGSCADAHCAKWACSV